MAMRRVAWGFARRLGAVELGRGFGLVGVGGDEGSCRLEMSDLSVSGVAGEPPRGLRADAHAGRQRQPRFAQPVCQHPIRDRDEHPDR
jgi:hypothetical protein